MASAELRVFTDYYAKLHILIQGEMISISSLAHSRHLLSSAERDKCTHHSYRGEEQANFFMQSMSSRIENDPQAFHQLLALLKAEPAFRYLTDQIDQSIKEVRAQWQNNEVPVQLLPPENPAPGAIGDRLNIDWDTLDNTPLKVGDVFDVFNEVVCLSAKYYSLGLALRLDPTALDTIKANHRDVKELLTDVLKEWLSSNYDTDKYGLPTWRLLGEAVAHRNGGNNCGLARTIAQKHQMKSVQSSS